MNEKFPIKVITNNGNSLVIQNELELYKFDGYHKLFKCDTTNDIVYVNLANRQWKFHGGLTCGDLKEIFGDKIYQNLPVKNKTIVDIGANIGDSAIYFSVHGAKNVLCIEPFPKYYELAVKNTQINHLNSNIKVVLAGLSNRKDHITIDPAYKSSGTFILKNFKTGIQVPMLTFEDILSELGTTIDYSILLKMDCEGCEYESILSASENILRRFDFILIEYHFGYRNLRKKLEKCGFQVSVTRPRIYSWSPDHTIQKIKFAEGYIFAEKY